MHRLKSIEDCLISLVQSQMGNTSNVCTEELGEVVDMIKDLEEAKYYHSITEAMEEQSYENGNKYFTPYLPERKENRPMIWNNDRDWGHHDSNMRNIPNYEGEGRSPRQRRMYMETKKLHKDSSEQMKELKKYMEELSNDITEMIQDSTDEEKTVLQHKLNELAQKITV